jgi:hypothetical protein
MRKPSVVGVDEKYFFIFKLGKSWVRQSIFSSSLNTVSRQNDTEFFCTFST